MEKKKENKALYIALSVLLAIFLWLYVGSDLNQEDESTYSVPVVFTGVDRLEERGLMITDGAEQKVTLKIRAPWKVLTKLSKDNISVTVDVSNITGPGSQSSGYSSIIYPSNISRASISSVSIVSASGDQNIKYTVARRSDREIEVRGVFNGEVAEGFQAGEFSITPGAVTVSGEEDAVKLVDYAQVVVSQEDELQETYSGERPIQLVGFDGSILDTKALKLETNVDSAYVTLPVVKLKEVPLTVEIVEGGGARESNARVEIEPRSIMVSGSEEALDGIKELSLGQVELYKVFSQDTFTFPIQLNTSLENVSGITEATVTVKISGLTTRTLEVDNIEFINQPEGCTVQPVTQSRLVQIRGEEEAVNAVIPSQISIVADLKGAASGNQTIPVKVYLNGSSDVGVVGGDYNIVVNIKRNG